MCSDAACDGADVPPVGEVWCPRRLQVELERWFGGFPMRCGPDLRLDPRVDGALDQS